MKHDAVLDVHEILQELNPRLNAPRAAIPAVGRASLRLARFCELQRTAMAIAILNRSAAKLVEAPSRIARKNQC